MVGTTYFQNNTLYKHDYGVDNKYQIIHNCKKIKTKSTISVVRSGNFEENTFISKQNFKMIQNSIKILNNNYERLKIKNTIVLQDKIIGRHLMLPIPLGRINIDKVMM